MYYLFTIINYDIWTFELNKYNEELYNLLVDVFEDNGISVQAIIKGTSLIDTGKVSSKSDLIDLLDSKLKHLKYEGDLDKINKLKEILKN